MSYFISIPLFSVLLISGVFASLGNGSKDEPPQTSTAPSINYMATTNIYVLTTEDVSGPHEPMLGYRSLRQRKQQEERKLMEAKWQRHRYYTGKCQLDKYVKIQDEMGCEMCTCIYEKSMMLCSPYECRPPGDTMLEEVGPSVYFDYVIKVQTNFNEYKCVPGEVLLLSAICACTCVAKDIISCPSTCHYGRQLN